MATSARPPARCWPIPPGRKTEGWRPVRPLLSQHLSGLTLSPNPASGEATLHFQLREAGPVNVTIQDMTGLTRAVALPPAQVAAGAHDVKLPLQKMQAGLYLVIVTSADGRQVMRLEVK